MFISIPFRFPLRRSSFSLWSLFPLLPPFRKRLTLYWEPFFIIPLLIWLQRVRTSPLCSLCLSLLCSFISRRNDRPHVSNSPIVRTSPSLLFISSSWGPFFNLFVSSPSFLHSTSFLAVLSINNDPLPHSLPLWLLFDHKTDFSAHKSISRLTTIIFSFPWSCRPSGRSTWLRWPRTV